MSSYKVSEPSALKFLMANGAVVDENGNVVNEATDYWKQVYDQAEPKVAKYLHADGTIDENPGSGSSVDLEDNHEVTITENGTVEITPTQGKDGMKKVTATVNVPSSGGSATAYAWKADDGYYSYLSVSVSPADETELSTVKNISVDNLGVINIINMSFFSSYTRVSDTEFKVSFNEKEYIFTRDSTREDVVIWG
jgi:hypothetical protein